MKRILLTLLAVCSTAAAAFAQSNRIVELGVDGRAGLSNNHFTIFDFYNNKPDKTLIVDMDELADKFAKSSFVLSGDTSASGYFNLNLSPDLKMGLFVAADAWAYGGVPGELLGIIANGNELDEPYSTTIAIQTNSFISAGAKIYLRTGKLGIGFTPSYFMPVAVVRDANVAFDFVTESDGSLVARADITIPVYSSVPLDEIEGLPFDSLINTLMGNGGLDFSLSADYRLDEEWLLKASLSNIPVLPARLNNLLEMTATFDYQVDNLTGQLMDDTMPEASVEQTSSSSLVEADDIVRAMKFNASALYTPSWFKALALEPSLGLGLYEGLVYIDFGLASSLHLGKVFTLQAQAERRDLIWYQNAGFVLDLRVLELEFNLGMASASFLSSYTANGIYGMLGIRLGF